MIYVMNYLLSHKVIREQKIYDTYALHKSVYSLFDDTRAGALQESSGILFVDKGQSRDGRALVILSNRLPKEAEYGMLSKPTELADGFFRNKLYRFEILVNPSKRSKDTGKIIPLMTPEEIACWFVNQSKTRGFSLIPQNFSVEDIFVDSFPSKDGTSITLVKARISGVLTVTDNELFKESVAKGIGRAKTFGCGLLQIAPLSL